MDFPLSPVSKFMDVSGLQATLQAPYSLQCMPLTSNLSHAYSINVRKNASGVSWYASNRLEEVESVHAMIH